MVVFYTFSSDKTVNNREKMALLCALLHFAHGYFTFTNEGELWYTIYVLLFYMILFTY